MNEKKSGEILNEIESGYDLIADKFSETRKYFWRGLEFIGDYTEDGSNVLDFGCGNGRILELLSEKNIKYWGIDISENLINIAKKRYCSNDITFLRIDSSQSSLAFNNDFFNTIYSIAVFHHFPGKKYRETIAKEIYRITKPGGYVIITVWNLWQKKYIKNILLNWRDKLLMKNDLDWNDCYISFKDNWGNSFNRYHHAFTKSELKNIFSKVGFSMEKCENTDGRNIVYIGKKEDILN